MSTAEKVKPLLTKDEEIFKCYVTNVLTSDQKTNLSKRFTLRAPRIQKQIPTTKRSTTMSKKAEDANLNFVDLVTLR
jgi:hypothetical protein